MFSAILDFSKRVAVLRDTLELAYKQAGFRKKRDIQNIFLMYLSWGLAHENAFLDLQDQIRQTVKLAHRKTD